MLGIEKLRVTLVEVILSIVIGNVCEVKEFKKFSRLMFHHVMVNAYLLSDGVLCTCVVQKFLFRYGLRRFINFVETESAHD